jgi:hypothetical protein
MSHVDGSDLSTGRYPIDPNRRAIEKVTGVVKIPTTRDFVARLRVRPARNQTALRALHPETWWYDGEKAAKID